MPTTTSNFGFLLPLVNDPTDQDLWGGYLNANASGLDSLLKTALNWTPSSQTSSFSIAAPTSGSTTTGGAGLLYVCNATSGVMTASLPAVASSSGMRVAFKKTDSSTNAITIQGHSSDNIDASNTFALASQYAFVVLACDGSRWNILSQTAPAGKTLVINNFTYAANNSYSASAGMVAIKVRMVGGGGGGGGPSQGGGGGAAEYAEGIFSAGSVSGSQAVTIGAGGSPGGSGGMTSLGSLMSAAGGGNGNSGVGAGGTGGSGGGGGSLHTAGQPGQGGMGGGSNFSGTGGSGPFGGGGPGLSQYFTGSGVNATGYGAGGGGANNSGNGGSGSGGLIIIEEYCLV